MRVTPAGVRSTFFTSAQTGLSAALAVLQGGLVVTGNVPNVMDSDGNPVRILQPGNSAQSYLIQALLGTGAFAPNNPNGWVQMPAYQSTYFSAAQVQAIADWIDNNCPP